MCVVCVYVCACHTQVMRFCLDKLDLTVAGEIREPGFLEGGDFFPISTDLAMVSGTHTHAHTHTHTHTYLGFTGSLDTTGPSYATERMGQWFLSLSVKPPLQKSLCIVCLDV